MKKRGRNTLTTFVPNNLNISKSLSNVQLSYEKDPKLVKKKKRLQESGTTIYEHLNKAFDVLRSASTSHVVRAEREGKPRGKKNQSKVGNCNPTELEIACDMSDTEGTYTGAESEAENSTGRSTGGGFSHHTKMADQSSRSNPVGINLSSSPLMDADVLNQLREADEKACRTAELIQSMKESIAKYTKKENLTDDDNKILQKKQEELMKKMCEFEEITKHVQNLVGLASVPSGELEEPSTAVPKIMAETIEKALGHSNREGKAEREAGSTPHTPRAVPPVEASLEERLPKVIVCGTEKGAEVPKIIVCDNVKGIDCKASPYSQYSSLPQGKGPLSSGEEERVLGQAFQPNQTLAPQVQQGYSPQGPSLGPSVAQGWQAPQWGPSGLQAPTSWPPQYPNPPWGGGQGSVSNTPGGIPEGMLGHLTERLDASYKLQEKLASENAEMEGTRYQLQEELLNKEQIIENLKREVGGLQTEMRLIVNENSELKSKHEENEMVYPKTPLCKMRLAREPICKRELQEQLPEGIYDDKQDVGCIVTGMENDVRAMQKELALVLQERKSLELQKKLLKCAGQYSGVGAPICKRQVTEAASTHSAPRLPHLAPPMPPPPPPPPCILNLENQLKEIKEQYKRLQEDYNAKLGEVSVLRVELESSKRELTLSYEKVEEAEARTDDLLDRLKILENEKIKMIGSKDSLMELEQQVVVAKQRFREGQEELEELKAMLQDQAAQVEDYRNKYLSAQETVETQRRQIDILELEKNRFEEQHSLEIQKFKSQFQDKLQELTPLPEILKGTQLRLQESQQLRAILERNCEELSRELAELKDKNERLTDNLDEFRSNKHLTEAERASLQICLTDGERKMEETKNENAKLKATVARLEELAIQNERRLEEKNHETLQLQTQLETLREESARQVSRTKDRCENLKRNFQSQISELERQLAQSRSCAKSAQKDRDEIRQKMQAQISQLNENFEQAQMRIRTLQSHVNILKTSYTNIFAPDTAGSDLGKVGSPYAPIEAPSVPPPISSGIESDFF